jgi:hypothetical protein
MSFLLHRSGRAQLRHPVRHVVDSLSLARPISLTVHAGRFNALGVFPASGPQRGSPFAPRGLGGPIPPLLRYYEALRLPAAHLAALRCLRLAIPSFRPLFVPASSGRELRIHQEFWVPGLQPAVNDGNDRVSQVPEPPSCPCALFFDPGRTEHARPLRRVDAAPACVYNGGSRKEYFEAQSHGIGTRCLRFAVRVTPPHARLASGCWPSSAGRDSLTRRVAMKGF